MACAGAAVATPVVAEAGIGVGVGAPGCACAAHATLAASVSIDCRQHCTSLDRFMKTQARDAQHGDEPLDRWMALAGIEQQDFPAAALYVVALPLGNAADITLRALWILARVDAIAAEDTRVTRPLLARYGIDVALLAAHRHNERASAEAILARLTAGQRVALVTDAGTPAVSDPGALVVRAALDAGLRVIPVPGASSAVAAVSAAGLAASSFQFVGFLPTGLQQRTSALAGLAGQPLPFVLYEAPHRVRALLSQLAAALAPERRVVIAREITKKFECISAHRAGELAALELRERGEFVFVVDAAEVIPAMVDPQTQRWLDALAAELPASRAAAVVAKVTGVARHELYEILKRRNDSD